MLLRPYGVVIDGVLDLGLEVELTDGVVTAVGPHTGMPDPYVLSPAFVNAHSHLEYRGLLNKIDAPDYGSWIREIQRVKPTQTEEELRQACRTAARENVETGVAFIAEHSDRPFSGEAMFEASLDGTIYQEIITFFERGSPHQKLAEIDAKADLNRRWTSDVRRAPHAYQTVDQQTLRAIGSSGESFSMHVAETDAENRLSLDGSGPLGEFYRSSGFEPPVTGMRLLPTLAGLGLVRPGAQFVHCCAVDAQDVAMLAAAGVAVAHCPRSNVRLKCPDAPVREMLDAGIAVGLGMDSAASAGPIDMFAEMRAALKVSERRGKAVSPEEVWAVATSTGARSLGLHGWRIEGGSSCPLIAIHVPGAGCTEDLIEHGAPHKTTWVHGVRNKDKVVTTAI